MLKGGMRCPSNLPVFSSSVLGVFERLIMSMSGLSTKFTYGRMSAPVGSNYTHTYIYMLYS